MKTKSTQAERERIAFESAKKRYYEKQTRKMEARNREFNNASYAQKGF